MPAAPCPALFAVHLADGLLADPVWVGGFVLAGALVAWSARGMSEDEVPRVGVLTAAFFVASQIHVRLGPTSAHLLLNGLVGVVLGRRAAVAIAAGLFLQALLFAHGGLTSLGVNVCILAGPALAAGLLFRPVRRAGRLPDVALGAVFGFFTAAGTVGLNFLVLRFAAKDDLGWAAWAAAAANLPAVVAEAVGVGFVVGYLGKVRPGWLE